MDNKKRKELKKFVYSIRITTEQNKLLKNNESIKRDLDKWVQDYFKIYLEK